jgi:hypothetical protein
MLVCELFMVAADVYVKPQGTMRMNSLTTSLAFSVTMNI